MSRKPCESRQTLPLRAGVVINNYNQRCGGSGLVNETSNIHVLIISITLVFSTAIPTSLFNFLHLLFLSEGVILLLFYSLIQLFKLV